MIDIITNSTHTENNLMQLKKACRGFEAILVKQMLKEMDKSVPEDPWIKNNAANSIYKSMYLDALSKKMAENSTFGIGKLLFNSLKEYADYKKDAKEMKQTIKPLKQAVKMIKLPKKIDLKPIERDVMFAEKEFFKKLNQKENDIKSIIESASRQYKVPKKLIYGIIKAESDFNPNSLSKAGAVGLMQLMPQTALELGVKDLWNVRENIFGGVKYISSLMKQFKNEKLAIAAYNAGPGNVRKYQGIPPFKETQNYVKKVFAYVDGKY